MTVFTLDGKRRADCPQPDCGQQPLVRRDGRLYTHRTDKGRPCDGSLAQITGPTGPPRRPSTVVQLNDGFGVGWVAS